MRVNSLPKTGTRQRRDCNLNPGPSAPESSTLTTRLPSHPKGSIENFNRPNIEGRISLTSRAAKLSEGRIEPSCQPKFTPSLCESLNRMLETGGRFQHEYAMFITPCLYNKTKSVARSFGGQLAVASARPHGNNLHLVPDR